MARPRLFNVYALTVALVGLGLAIVTTVLEAPHDVHSWQDDVVSRGLILLILTFLSSFAPMKTRYGASLTVGLAPLFGALLTLPPWAVMWVAAVGTMDEIRKLGTTGQTSLEDIFLGLTGGAEEAEMAEILK